MPADAIPRDLGPIPAVVGDQLYVVRNRAVAMVEADGTPPKAQPVLGDLGEARYRVDSLAISTANTDLAAVTNRRTKLRWSETATGEVTTVVSGARNLLRPQFSGFDELWAVSGSGRDQRCRCSPPDEEIEVSAEKVLGKGEVTAFRISPDGARIALIRKSGDRSQLGIARIRRAADKITVDGWRPLNTTQTGQPHLLQLQDVAWIDATDLLGPRFHVCLNGAAALPDEPGRVEHHDRGRVDQLGCERARRTIAEADSHRCGSERPDLSRRGQ